MVTTDDDDDDNDDNDDNGGGSGHWSLFTSGEVGLCVGTEQAYVLPVSDNGVHLELVMAGSPLSAAPRTRVHAALHHVHKISG